MIAINSQPYTLISGSSDVDSISNSGSNVTINAGWGDDSVVNAADNVSINAGFGNDFVFVAAGSNNTIKGFDGNDTITLGADSSHNLIEYAYYDDSDLILGLRADDSIKIIGSAATNITIPGEENVRLRVDSSTITLRGANALNLIGTGYRDTIRNLKADVTIDAGDDNDTINNFASNVGIYAGAGNDSILINSSTHSTLNGGDGDDTISLRSSGNLIDYTNGSDLVLGFRASDSIRIIEARDFTVQPAAPSILITTDSDEVTLRNTNFVRAIGSSDDNLIVNRFAGATINGGAGNDTITNSASLAALNGGDGNDKISNSAYRATIVCSDGNDVINVNTAKETNYIVLKYDGAGGRDTIKNFSRHDILYLTSGNVVERRAKGNDYIVSIDGGSLTFKNIGITPIRTLDSNGRTFAINYDLSNFGDRAKMLGSGAGDSIINTGSYTTVDGGDGDDFINNYGSRVTIAGGYGDDLIENSGGSLTSMVGGAGNDTIINDAGNKSTISGDWGDDRIILIGDSVDATLNYFSGDGRDTVDGFDRYKVLRLVDGTVGAHHSIGNDYIISVDGGSIRLTDVGITPIPVINSAGKISAVNYDISNYAMRAAVSGTSEGEWIFNAANNAIVNAFDGNDLIYNWGQNARFNGGAGDDTIINVEQGATITGGDGADSIINEGRRSSIVGGDGNNVMRNSAEQVTMVGGNDDDLIYDSGAAVIRTGAGNDTVVLDGGRSRIEYTSGDGDNVIVGLNAYSTIRLVDGTLASNDYVGDDYVFNIEGRTGAGLMLIKNAGLTPIRFRGQYGQTSVLNYDVFNTVEATVFGGTSEDDRIFNEAARVTVLGLAGNDTIYNTGDDATIDGGSGDDTIEIHSARSVIKYSGGNDEIIGLDGDDTISIDYGDWYATMRSGSDVTVELENGSIRLRDVADDDLNIVGGTYGRSIVNVLNNKVITGTAANDTITNTGWRVSIKGLAGDDHIFDSGADVTINAGAGDNTIELNSSWHVIEHDGGNDTIFGLDGNDTVLIEAGRAYTTVQSDSDIILNAGISSIECKGMANRTLNVKGGVLVENNYIVNELDSVSVVGTDEADYVWNLGARATINAGTGNDTLEGSGLGDLYLFSSAYGDNVIVNFGVNDSIRVTAGKLQSIETVGNDAVVNLKGTNYSGSVLLKGAADYRFVQSGSIIKVEPINAIVNRSNGVKVIGSADDDSIVNYGSDVTIQSGAGNDTIVGSKNGEMFLFASNTNDNVILNFDVNDTLKCTAGTIRSVTTVGDDALVSMKGAKYEGTVLLKGAGDYRFAYNDSVLKIDPFNKLINEADGVKVVGSADDDSIVNYGADVTISSGKGNDTIVGSEYGELYLFSSADGNNLIDNFGRNDTIKTTAGKIVDVMTVDDDAIVSLKGTNYSGTVTLAGAGNYDFDWTASMLTVVPLNEIVNEANEVKVVGTSNADSIVNSGAGVTIQGGGGSDTIFGSEHGEMFLFSSADGNNLIENFGRNDTIKCTAGKIVDVTTLDDDAIVSLKGTKYSGTVTLKGAGGYDFKWSSSVLKVLPINEIVNEADGVKVVGTSNADSIVNYGADVTIQANAGNDTLTGSEQGQLYLFASNTDDNVITNFGVNDTLKCTAGKIVDVTTVDDDTLVSLKGSKYSGSVLLKSAGAYEFEWSSSMLTPSTADYWFLDESAPLDDIDLISNADDVIDPLALDDPTILPMLDCSARSDPTLALTDARHREI